MDESFFDPDRLRSQSVDRDEPIIGPNDLLVEFETPLVCVWTLRDRKVVHFQSFIDPQPAFEAAGLRE